MRVIAGTGFLILGVLLSGCDAVFDCLDDDGPEFDKTQLETAVLNQVYSEAIRASVNNEPQDQRFDYTFILTGSLPQGVTEVSVGQRWLLTGTPTESGSFPLSLYVEVDDGLSAADSGLCFVSHASDYLLQVNEQ